MDVTVCRSGDARFAAKTVDVSLTGMGLSIDRDAARALAQGGSVLTPGDSFDLVLCPFVEAVDGVIGPKLEARVRHARRLSQHEYHVGVWFDALDQGQQSALQAIVDQAQQRTR
jgi:c-di-GMP-binding flagellar brake protein YcgR